MDIENSNLIEHNIPGTFIEGTLLYDDPDTPKQCTAYVAVYIGNYEEIKNTLTIQDIALIVLKAIHTNKLIASPSQIPVNQNYSAQSIKQLINDKKIFISELKKIRIKVIDPVVKKRYINSDNIQIINYSTYKEKYITLNKNKQNFIINITSNIINESEKPSTNLYQMATESKLTTIDLLSLEGNPYSFHKNVLVNVGRVFKNTFFDGSITQIVTADFGKNCDTPLNNQALTIFQRFCYGKNITKQLRASDLDTCIKLHEFGIKVTLETTCKINKLTFILLRLMDCKIIKASNWIKTSHLAITHSSEYLKDMLKWKLQTNPELKKSTIKRLIKNLRKEASTLNQSSQIKSLDFFKEIVKEYRFDKLKNEYRRQIANIKRREKHPKRYSSKLTNEENKEILASTCWKKIGQCKVISK